MAAKTPTEKINELSNLVAALTAQLDALRDEVTRIGTAQEKLSESLSEAKTKLALLEQHLADLKTAKQEWGRRWWAIVRAIAGAVAGAVAGGILTYLLKR